jgi:hypothetical protein
MHNIAQYDEYITALEKLQKNNKSKLQWSQLPLYKYGFLTFIVILTYVKNFINKIKCIYYALLGFEHLSTQTRRTTVQLRKIPKETIQELIRRYLQEIYDKTLDDIRLEPSQGETSDKVNERKKTILDSILNAHFKYTRKINLFDSLSPDSKHFRMYDYYRYLPEFVQGSIHQIIEGYTDDILIYNSFFLDFFLLYRLFQLIQRNQTRYIPIFIGDSHFEIIQNTLLSLLNPNLEFDWDRNRFTISKVFEHKQPKYGIPPQIPLRIPRLIRNPSNNQTTPYIDQYKRRLQLDKIQTQQQQQKKRKQQQQSQPLTATI